MKVLLFTSDDIQAAIDQTFDRGGGTVRLLAGTYIADGDITLRSGVNLVGEGYLNTIIDFGGTSYGIKVHGSDSYTTGTIAVSNGSTSVVGTGTSWTAGMAGRSILLKDFWYTISSVTDSTHLVVTDSYTSSTIAGYSYAIANPITSVQLQGFTAQNTTGSVISFRYGNGVTYNNIYLFDSGVGFDHDFCADINSNVTSAENCTTGWILNRVHFATWYNINAISCTTGFDIDDFTNVALAVFTAESCTTGVSMNLASNLGVENFSIQGCTGRGIDITNTTLTAFIGGVVVNNTSDGIRVDGDGVIFSQCNVEDNGGYGVNVLGTDTLISGNTVRGNSSGAVNNSGTGTVVRGNIGVVDSG